MSNKTVKLIKFLIIAIAVISAAKSFAQEVIPLYDGKIPNSITTPNKEHENGWHFLVNITEPTLTVFSPPAGSANGVSVLICPGGGYTALNIKNEGYKVAERLNSIGIIASVLKYRLPDDSTMKDKSIGPLQDAQKALLIIKKRAKEWNIDTTKVGIMGFSAGGHLASSVSTNYNRSFIDNPTNISLRPNFMILVYPVISFMDSVGHKDSRTALIGKNPTATKIAEFSNELQVNANTPPTFLIQAGDDSLVPVQNSILFYLALQKNKVPAGLHIFPKGQHGFVLQPASSTWFKYCAEWLHESGWIIETPN